MASSAMAVVWAWSLLFLLANAATGIGVNWGPMCSKQLPPRIVVPMLKENEIDKVKFLDADPDILRHFAKTGIEVMVGITNQSLREFRDQYSHAKYWVEKNVHKHVNDGVDIKYVSVGNEALSKEYNYEHEKTLLPAMKNIQKALDEAGLGEKIKATTTFKSDALFSATELPSGSDFRQDIKDTVVEIVEWLDANKSPFILNMNPFRALYENPESDIEYAFFDNNITSLDKGMNYTNAFDDEYDALVTALEKAGVPNMEIIIGEIGWPTDGTKNANITTAKRFYDGLVKKIASDIGTPLRPKQHIPVYILSLLDENMRSIVPGPFERHWGIFTFDGKVKFPIDFAGKGRANFPVAAKGVALMPPLWCLLNLDVKNLSLLQATVDYACRVGDCTVLAPGASCGDLTFPWNVSYAFNIYYQMYNQDDDSCIFHGYGHMVAADKEKNGMANITCPFPVQIASSTRSDSTMAVRLVMILLIFSVIG